MKPSVLVVDDEKNIRRTLSMVLEGAGYQVTGVASAEEALALLRDADFDLAILDIRLPNMTGIEALEMLRGDDELKELPVIMISGHASVAEAVHAVQLGAADFFEKPLDRDRVLVSVANALKTGQLQRELRRLRNQVGERYKMIGETPVMKDLYQAIEKVAPTKGRVLITGESGSGKELVARAIHNLSPREEHPFVMLNCAAIPAELIESELFGYEKGAFTGAQGRKKGKFELADGGTLFLDEIGDMSAGAQAKVLRALQSGEITRVGSEKPIAVDVRVLAATNKDLEAEVARGAFREDLFYRLNVVPVRSPSLRERRGDIPVLARTFLDDFFRDNGLRPKPCDDEVFEALKARPWPGNVRELKNVVERMVILSGDRITLRDLPGEGLLDQDHRSTRQPTSPSQDEPSEVLPSTADGLSLREFRDAAEKHYIMSTLDDCEWNISKAAHRLGVERTNLHKKMRTLGIKRDV